MMKKKKDADVKARSEETVGEEKDKPPTERSLMGNKSPG